MFDRRYVYLMQRTRKNRARLLGAWKMLNAARVERKMHILFESSRFEMRKTKRPPAWGVHIKIGISEDPEKRLEYINKSGLKSGRTEWFYFTPGEKRYLHRLLWWYQIEPVAWPLLFFGVPALIAFFITKS